MKNVGGFVLPRRLYCRRPACKRNTPYVLFYEKGITMSRRAKNIIMIVLALLLCASMIFTVSFAAKSQPDFSQLSGSPTQGQQMPGQSGDDQNSDQHSNDQNSDSQKSGQPPQMPDQNGGQSGGQSGQTPQMPDQNGEQSGGQSGQPPQMANFPNGNMKPGGFLDGKFLALFGAEALAFALIVLYLIMSGMNRKTFRETFRSRDKVLIFVLAALLAGGCLTQAEAGVSRYLGAQNLGQQQMQLPGGDQESSAEATGATTIDGTEETLNDSYTSTEADENAVLVTGGGTLTSDGATIDKKSGDSSNTESSDFSGVNAALLVKDNSTATVKNATIKTSAKGANGVFATGEKSTITISDSTITTTGEASSRGLDATYGGTIKASNMKITTQGGSCAAMATDRGEGTVTATKSTLETNGAGSPVIYSTGDITLTDSEGTANGAQIAVVEGKNSATIKNSQVTCSAAGNRGDVDIAGVMVYQSMSGDASEGTGNFTAEDADLSVSKDSSYYKTAPMFFVTNTDAVIDLTDTDLSFGSGVLLSAKGTSEWGNEGSNGGTVTLNAAEQTLKGDIQLDDISSLTMNISDGSTYTGTINGDNSAKSVTLKLDKTSSIKLTGDTYVTALEDADSSYGNIDFNGHKLYVNGKAIN